MSRIRILYVTDAKTMGGAEWSLVDLLRNLDRDKFSAVLAAPAGAGVLSCVEQDGVRVVTVPIARVIRTWNPFRLLHYVFSFCRSLWKLRKCVQEEGIDIVHANTASAQIYCALLAMSCQVLLVWQCRDLRYGRRICRWMVNQADCVVAISETVHRFLLQMTDCPHKIVTVMNGIDVERLGKNNQAARRDFRAESGIPAEAFVVGMIGQYTPWKNHEIFLQTASRIREQIPNSYFVIMGTVHDRQHARYLTRLRQVAYELNVYDIVSFLTYRSDVQSFYTGIDLLLHPAQREPFGRVVLESMLHSRPVVIADDGSGPQEIVSHGRDGMLVAPRTAENLARAVVEFAKDEKKMEQFGEAGQQKVENQFSAKAMSARMGQVYLHLLQQESPDAAVSSTDHAS